MEELKEVEIEELLTPAKLKDWVNEEDGAVIRLVDIEHTKKALKGLANKYKELKITRENYKEEGANAERELRETRYALQKIHKKNNKYLNDVKREEKSLFDSLILITEEVEDRLKGEINAIEGSIKKEKEEEENKERLRVEKIESLLEEWEKNLNTMLTAIENEKQLQEYDKSLDELSESFSHFEEFEFKAKRIHAVFTGRRSEAVDRIETAKKIEADKKEVEEAKKQLEAKKEKIVKYRSGKLLELGFIQQGNGMFNEALSLRITNDEIFDKDEVDWAEYIEQTVSDIEKKKNEALELIQSQWKDALIIFESLGGDTKSYKEVKIPTHEDLERLRKHNFQLQKKTKMLKIEGVKNEIKPLQDNLLKTLGVFEDKIDKTSFEHEESRTIMKNLMERFAEVINEVLGEVNS